MEIYKHKLNTELNRKFLIPRNRTESNTNWVEVQIDKKSEIFIAKKKVIEKIDLEEWTIFDDYTFPSSILNEFLRS